MTDTRPVRPVHTRPLREVKPIPPPQRGDDLEHPEPIRPEPPLDATEPDTVRQSLPGAIASAPTATGISFEGVGVGISGFTPSSNPPDVNGHVGATQYVQWNNTSFAVWDKSGTLLYGPAAGKTLFQSLGGACASHNDGDPIVNYDILAGRWILSQFVVGASPDYSHQCFAVSETGDATGAYYLYDFVTDPVNFVDYPHIGVWPDGYYMTTHVFDAAGTSYLAGRVNVFERTKMLAGLPARQVSAVLKTYANKVQYGFLPADLDSATPPPVGEAAFILGPDPQLAADVDSTRVAVTWGVVPTITLTEARIGVTSAATATCAGGPSSRQCVPQPLSATAADYLDNISSHFMYRLAYRNFGGTPVQESLVANETVDGAAPAHDAIRWYEFRNAGSSTTAPTVFQQSTYDPDTDWRWLGSIAMDKDHNIALGYSKSSLTVIPGIYLTGRLGTDTLNTMGAEVTVRAGVGVQLGGGNRWGDYSAMTLDPIDQCTFWYTNEYLPTDGQFNWATRIAAYKFPSCSSAPAWGTVSGTVTSCATGSPLSGVLVTLSNGFAGATNASGAYSIAVPPGSYTATAADTARNCSASTPPSAGITVSSGGTATQNFCMSGTSNIQLSSRTIDDSTTGNNNGVVNSNECLRLNVALANNGCANETAISATLSSSTPGVTITQPGSTYPDIAVDATRSNATAFGFQTSSSFTCGVAINFTLNVTYAGGSKSIGFTVPTCAGGPAQSIPSSSIALTDGAQTDRLGRDGSPSGCGGKGCPGGIGTAGTRNYKTFNFTNSASAPACMTVQISAACGGSSDIESAAYLGSYDPANLCTNYLGDSGVVGLGNTLPSSSYSFTVPANSNFVVVVNTNAAATTCTQFSGSVSGFYDFTPGPGACPVAPPAMSPFALDVDPAGNRVLEPGEAATVKPSWLNVADSGPALALTSTATSSGLTVTDGSADYGSIADGASAFCSNCFGVTAPGTRPSTHWDLTLTETPSTVPSSIIGPKSWTIHVGNSFTDVPLSSPFYRYIETLLHHGVTNGCSPTTPVYCPGASVPREQMAAFLARTLAGSDAAVPSTGVVGTSSYDCSASGNSLFTDVDRTSPFCRHIHYIAAQKITQGCGTNLFCPADSTPRGQMGAFVGRALVAPAGDAGINPSAGPDPVTGRSYDCTDSQPNFFSDVPDSSPFCKQIYFIWSKGVVDGFADQTYGPSGLVTREQMAKFIANAFRLNLYEP